MLDAHLTATRAGYADYVRRTSSFVPVLRARATEASVPPVANGVC
jgi:steroid 5-alpha reductase family enzyme